MRLVLVASVNKYNNLCGSISMDLIPKAKTLRLVKPRATPEVPLCHLQFNNSWLFASQNSMKQ